METGWRGLTGWMEGAWLDGGVWKEGGQELGACGWKVFERELDGGMDGVVLRFGSCRVSVQRFAVFCGSQG